RRPDAGVPVVDAAALLPRPVVHDPLAAGGEAAVGAGAGPLALVDRDLAPLRAGVEPLGEDALARIVHERPLELLLPVVRIVEAPDAGPLAARVAALAGLDADLGPRRPLAVLLAGDVAAARRDLAVRVVLHVGSVELAVLHLGALEELAGPALLDARRIAPGDRRNREQQQGPPHGDSTPFSAWSALSRTGLPSRLERSLCVTDTLGAKAAAWNASSASLTSFLPPPPQANWVPFSSRRQICESLTETLN